MRVSTQWIPQGKMQDEKSGRILYEGIFQNSWLHDWWQKFRKYNFSAGPTTKTVGAYLGISFWIILIMQPRIQVCISISPILLLGQSLINFRFIYFFFQRKSIPTNVIFPKSFLQQPNI